MGAMPTSCCHPVAEWLSHLMEQPQDQPRERRNMASEKLTALKVGRATKPGLYGDGRGLYLRLGTGDAKSWVLRYMTAGRAHEMGLGSAADFTFAE